MIRQGSIDFKEVGPAAFEATQNISARHVMTTLSDSGCNPTEGQLGRGKTKISNLDRVTSPFPVSHSLRITQATQRALERKVRLCCHESVQFAQHEAACGNGRQFRTQW